MTTVLKETALTVKLKPVLVLVIPLDIGDFAHGNFSFFHGTLKKGTLYKFGTKCVCKGNPLSGGGRLFQNDDRSSVLFPCVQAERSVLSNA